MANPLTDGIGGWGGLSAPNTKWIAPPVQTPYDSAIDKFQALYHSLQGDLAVSSFDLQQLVQIIQSLQEKRAGYVGTPSKHFYQQYFYQQTPPWEKPDTLSYAPALGEFGTNRIAKVEKEAQAERDLDKNIELSIKDYEREV